MVLFSKKKRLLTFYLLSRSRHLYCLLLGSLQAMRSTDCRESFFHKGWLSLVNFDPPIVPLFRQASCCYFSSPLLNRSPVVVYCILIVGIHVIPVDVVRVKCVNAQEKRWQLYILPQYHAKLTQPIKYKESHIFALIVPVLTVNDIVNAGFENISFLFYVFMSVVKAFVCVLRIIGKCTNRHPLSYKGFGNQI